MLSVTLTLTVRSELSLAIVSPQDPQLRLVEQSLDVQGGQVFAALLTY